MDTACTAGCARTIAIGAALQAACHIGDTAGQCRIAGRGEVQDKGCCMGSLAGQGSEPSSVKVFHSTTSGKPWVRCRSMQVFDSDKNRHAKGLVAAAAAVAAAVVEAQKQKERMWAIQEQEPGEAEARAGGMQRAVGDAVQVDSIQ